ncbi:MarR family winged helix-turn-helix transcriptional regulator [Curtobacterium flaccumfaciens pv. flaccumfaciens]|uniref:MarR family winged helix-turn-helix transcriptional regulator n=1 Tax=Curtobacterium flaccumfaciens TaxID=2035 RepID=UPI0039911852
MANRLSHQQLDAWQRLQTVTERLRRHVGRDLRGDAGLSEAEFTVLAHLVEYGGTARPSECAASIGWDSSRLAHQLRRLESRGLITRSPSPGTDGRGSIIALTAPGKAAHSDAVGPHLRAAATWFGAALTPTELDHLRTALTAIAAHIDLLESDSTEEKE